MKRKPTSPPRPDWLHDQAAHGWPVITDHLPLIVAVVVALVAMSVVRLTWWRLGPWLAEAARKALTTGCNWATKALTTTLRAAVKSVGRAVKRVATHFLSPKAPEVPDSEALNPPYAPLSGAATWLPATPTTSPTPLLGYPDPAGAEPMPPRRGRPPTERRPPVTVRCATCAHEWESLARSGAFVACPGKCGGRSARVPIREDAVVG